ncbi:hypothetical protein D3C75_1106640 [compost metagenome]
MDYLSGTFNCKECPVQNGLRSANSTILNNRQPDRVQEETDMTCFEQHIGMWCIRFHAGHLCCKQLHRNNLKHVLGIVFSGISPNTVNMSLNRFLVFTPVHKFRILQKLIQTNLMKEIFLKI